MVESEVTVFDAIGVQHRDYLKDKELSKEETGFAVREEEFNESLNEERRVCFGGVNSCRDEYHWIIFESAS